MTRVRVRLTNCPEVDDMGKILAILPGIRPAAGIMTPEGSTLPSGLLIVRPEDPGAGAALRLVHIDR